VTALLLLLRLQVELVALVIALYWNGRWWYYYYCAGGGDGGPVGRGRSGGTPVLVLLAVLVFVACAKRVSAGPADAVELFVRPTIG
jgi:hypothetical protein